MTRKPHPIDAEAKEYTAQSAKKKKRRGFFSSKEVLGVERRKHEAYEQAMKKAFQKPMLLREITANGTAMDKAVSMDSFPNINGNFGYNGIIPQQQLEYFANQSFIGYNLCALLSQHWLIMKCCLVPARDAIRNGYELSVNDGTEVQPDVIEAIKKADVAYNLNHNLIQFVQMGRIFGIRVAMFEINFGSDEERDEFYENPFNIDAVTPGSYRGISQIDPYWMTYQLGDSAAGDPSSINFYEPTWWIINSRRIHYSHLIIFRTEEVPDILKSTYFYGGIPIPQKVYQRVYAAERCANEVPMLLLSKRTSVITLDVTQAVVEPGDFEHRMGLFANNHNNFGIKSIGEDEKYEQFDTTLADVDEVTMMQYELVAAEANVPATKLLGTSPKGGVAATGNYEEASYHEELESIQSCDLAPLIKRHHQLLMVSDIAPQFGIAPFGIDVAWASLDAMTAKEQAELNERKAKTDKELLMMGAIDGGEVRERLIKDPDSGYSGLLGEPKEAQPEEEKPQQSAAIENDYGT